MKFALGHLWKLQVKTFLSRSRKSFLSRQLLQHRFTTVGRVVVVAVAVVVVVAVVVFAVAQAGGTQTTLKTGRNIQAMPTKTETEKISKGMSRCRFPTTCEVVSFALLAQYRRIH